MGGRGYKNDVKNYLDGNRRTVEFKAAFKSIDGIIDILYDIQAPKNPTMPIFSNSPNKIYAVIGKNGEIKSIGFYDERHMLIKTIHLDHFDNDNKPWHVHDGDSYHHVNGVSRKLTEEEEKIVKKILKIWKEKRKN